MDNRDPLNLKSLPEERAPANLWPAIESRLSSRGHGWPKAAGLAAAGFAAALVLAVVSVQRGDETPPADSLADLQARSAALEEIIAPLRPVAPAAETAQQEALIESLLAEVDQALNFNPNHTGLWTRRVQLLDTLAETYSEDWLEHQVQLTSM